MTEREFLAAEYVLRLLEGEELLEARRLAATDLGFAADVQAWEERLSPLFDAIAEEPAPAELWPSIERRLAETTGGNVVQLKKQLVRWRVGTAAAAAAAAVLLALQLRPQSPIPAPAPPAATPAPLLLASLASEDGREALTVVYRSGSRELMVEPARLSRSPSRARELWIIPAGAKPISLGLINPVGAQRRSLDPALAATFRSGATIAVSDEPSGGSPTGQPTGDVLVAGNLTLI